MLSCGPPPVEALNLTRPQTVQSLYRRFCEAGAQLLISNTFCCDPDSLNALCNSLSRPLSELRGELCRKGVQWARDAGPQLYVGGSLGPGWKRPSRGEISLQELRDDYADWGKALLGAGVDALYLETVRDPLQAEAAVEGLLWAQSQLQIDCPIAVLVSPAGRRIGDWQDTEVLDALLQLPIQALGVNCSDGPETLIPALDYLAEHSSLPLLCAANAGVQKTLSPQAYAAALKDLTVRFPLAEVRGCCGVGAEHLPVLYGELSRAA